MGLLYLKWYQMPHEQLLIEPHLFGKIEDHSIGMFFLTTPKKKKGISRQEAMELPLVWVKQDEVMGQNISS